MNNFSFDTDLSKSDDSNMIGRAIAIIAGIALMSFSAITSFAFFATYAADMFAFISPQLGWMLAGILGVISYEGMALVWRYLRPAHADTHQQIKIAQIGGYMSLFGGVLVTIVYFSLQTSMLANVMDARATMLMSIVGSLLMIVGVSGNFALWYFYSDSGSANQEGLHQATITAMSNQARFKINQASTYQTLQRTMDHIAQELPSATSSQAKRNSQRFINDSFSSGHQAKNMQGFSLVDEFSNDLIGETDDDDQAKNSKGQENFYTYEIELGETDPNQNGRSNTG